MFGGLRHEKRTAVDWQGPTVEGTAMDGTGPKARHGTVIAGPEAWSDGRVR